MRRLKYSFTIILVFFTSLQFSSCNKEDNVVFDKNGIAIKLPHLWQTPITDTAEKRSEIVVATPIIYQEDNVLVGANKNLNRAILSIRSTDGKVNWEWNDLLSLLSNPNYKDPIILDVEACYLSDQNLFFNYSTSSYCLNLETGQTFWKYKTPDRSRFSVNGGIDNTYFTTGSTYEPLGEEKIYSGSIESSEEEELLLEPEFTRVENPAGTTLGRITSMAPFKNGDITYLSFGLENPYTDFTTMEGMGATELNLYNITERKYEYKKVVVNPNRETRWIGIFIINHPISTFKLPTTFIVLMQ